MSSKKGNIAMRTYCSLRYTKRCDDFFFVFFGHVLGLTGRRLSLHLDPTAREFPSPLVTVFDVPIASMRASAMQSYFKITNLLCEWHAGFCGGYFSPSECKKAEKSCPPLESLVPCIPQVYETLR